MTVPVLESVFLSSSVVAEATCLGRVLVLGSHATAHELERRLRQESFEVITVGGGDIVDGAGNLQRLTDTVLEEVRGFVGRYEAVISSSSGRIVEPIGFIVAAPAALQIPKFHNHGLTPSGRVQSLSQVEVLLDNPEKLVKARGELFHVAFFCGLKGESYPETFSRVFNVSARLSNTFPVQAYVFTKDVKVAAPGLERRYRFNREGGTLFFKFDGEGPNFEEGTEGLAVVFRDPVLGIEMELVPDLIVVDEDIVPAPSLRPLLDAIPSSSVSEPFLQPASLRFSGVTTPKAGILAVGPSRGSFDFQSTASDIEAVVVAMKSALRGDDNKSIPGPPQVDSGKCTVCLTCIRLCPHGAMGFHKRAEADPASCRRCGICAAECPMEAITLESPEGQYSLDDRITKGLKASESVTKIVAFLCRRSAAQAFETASVVVRGQIIAVSVQCAGTIAPAHIFLAFRNGADGVLVAGCHKGNCASIYGTVLAGERVSAIRNSLEQVGLDPNKLMFATLASNTPGDLLRAVRNLNEIVSNTTDSGLM